MQRHVKSGAFDDLVKSTGFKITGMYRYWEYMTTGRNPLLVTPFSMFMKLAFSQILEFSS
jgi:hypothetical protein